MARFGTISPRRRLVAIVVGLLVLAAIIAYWVAYTSQETGMADDLPSTAERTIVSSTDVVYPDPEALTASSDLVVEGTVQDVDRGGTWTFAADSGIPESGQVDRLLEISVDRTVYSASGADSPRTILVLEGIWEAGVGIQRVEMPWAQPGDRGIFFLVDYEEYRDNTTFNYVSPAGRVLVTEEAAVLADHHGPTWQAAGFTMDSHEGSADPAQVRRAVLDAAAHARSGAAEPVTDPPAPPCPRAEMCPQFEPAGRG